ncbi:MAG: hypothetical protein A2092_12070 [Rhodobacteraceae bacterium GWE1_64_9]|nr:MAG: hypothetical protein A2092_12070 [Rhodobacteraceae bacterium GWE1_64_9]HBD91782.1 chromosome partitioning protein ParB [Gemmobacter sp.]HBU14076.1 chromosome partitioning protein ParB [Gemmobacter sp.]
MPEILELPLASIEVGTDRARDLDPFWADGLAAIIAAQGLMVPILVRAIGDGRYRLVAGLHRLEAFRRLERGTIPAQLSEAASDDEARLQEVMENLGRAELIALDRCHHLYELKQVWERMHPSFANGGGNQRGGGKSFPTDAGEVFGFAASVAERIGLSKRAINLDVKIWKGLSPASRVTLVGTDLATKQTELRALSEEKPARQAKILELILGDMHPINNVAQAIAFLDSGKVPTAHEKTFVKVSATLAALDDETFDAVVSANEERVIATLKRRGRI